MILTSHTPIDIDAAVTDMETIKHIKLSRIERANVTVCLQSISNIHSVIAMTENTKKQSFHWENPTDYALIDRYWTAMFPSVRRKHATISAEWGELGFQGTDPATDFRGMGILGLIQLEYFAVTRTDEARKVLADSMHPRRYYPFSATGINITAFVLEMLRENRLHPVLLHRLETYCLESRSSQMASPVGTGMMYASENSDTGNELLSEACLALHEIYCDVFVAFNDLWVQRDPQNIMSFASIFDEVKYRVRVKYPAIGQ